MAIYDFILRFDLPDPTAESICFTDAIFEAGCDDAVVGVGLLGSIALDFSRAAPAAKDAVSSAIKAVTEAIPGVKLSEIRASFQVDLS